MPPLVGTLSKPALCKVLENERDYYRILAQHLFRPLGLEACETDMPKRTLLSGALYLGYYLALGAYYPYINLYFERLGFTGIQIGTLSAIPVLISSSTVMIWGGLADRYRWHHRILRTNLLLCALSVLLLSTAGSFQAIIPFIAGFALFNSPLVPLLDNTALEAIEGSKNSYGQVRVWGSIGWSISTVLVD
jgi:PPP family 3-phenylpropionic acid transporter